VIEEQDLVRQNDITGHLMINYPMNKKENKIRIVLLVDEVNDDSEEEKLWMKSISSNPVFDFLKESNENIYSLTDGEPFND
jgi:hypothetical protein